MVGTVSLLCGWQNIPLRGHRDSGLDVDHNATACHGNFWALLEFRIAAGDSILQNHLASAPRIAMYTSPDIQNQIIYILQWRRKMFLSRGADSNMRQAKSAHT